MFLADLFVRGKDWEWLDKESEAISKRTYVQILRTWAIVTLSSREGKTGVGGGGQMLEKRWTPEIMSIFLNFLIKNDNLYFQKAGQFFPLETGKGGMENVLHIGTRELLVDRSVHYFVSVVDFICIYKCQNHSNCSIQIYVIYFKDISIMSSNF